MKKEKRNVANDLLDESRETKIEKLTEEYKETLTDWLSEVPILIRELKEMKSSGIEEWLKINFDVFLRDIKMELDNNHSIKN